MPVCFGKITTMFNMEAGYFKSVRSDARAFFEVNPWIFN